MLILVRKPGESIYIGDDIELTVLSLSEGRVKIGITAPKDVQIVRDDCKKVLHGMEIRKL